MFDTAIPIGTCRAYALLTTSCSSACVLLVLQDETNMCRVVDPWGGSYMMESLTQELVDGARKLIADVDALGGMAKAIASGMPKMR